MKEVFKPIKGYEDLYLISNLGNLYIIKKKRFVKKNIDKDGYEKVTLYKNGKREHTHIHRLVAKMFLPNPENKPLVLHKIPISKGGTNCADNLYWGTQNENMIDKVKDGNYIVPNTGERYFYCKINQYDKAHNYIKTWDSQKQIEKELGIAVKNLSRHLKGQRKSVHGFIFEYA